ncbi:MAG: hypothetical protein ACSHYA_18090 [Opitutaceae bacterium]
MNIELIKIFRECFPSLADASEESVMDATVDSVSDWESVTSLNLLVFIEETFDITIPDEVAADLNSYLIIEDYLESGSD